MKIAGLCRKALRSQAFRLASAESSTTSSSTFGRGHLPLLAGSREFHEEVDRGLASGIFSCKDEHVPRFAGISRGFATDALTAPSSGLPPTVAAIKNPTNHIVYDEVIHERYPPGDPNKRAFTYFVLTGGRFIYASALRLLVLKFIISMSASRDVLAMASLEVELASIAPGATVTVKWRGKPVFIRHRTEDDIKRANTVNMHELRDPEADDERVRDPQWLVVVGVCTHLGCVPLPNAGDYNGWFCPCHGSHYDVSGRVRKGPAPYNLEVPTYKFLEDGKLLIG